MKNSMQGFTLTAIIAEEKYSFMSKLLECKNMSRLPDHKDRVLNEYVKDWSMNVRSRSLDHNQCMLKDYVDR